MHTSPRHPVVGAPPSRGAMAPEAADPACAKRPGRTWRVGGRRTNRRRLISSSFVRTSEVVAAELNDWRAPTPADATRRPTARRATAVSIGAPGGSTAAMVDRVATAWPSIDAAVTRRIAPWLELKGQMDPRRGVYQDLQLRGLLNAPAKKCSERSALRRSLVRQRASQSAGDWRFKTPLFGGRSVA
jgi:hypothetical protein